MDYTVPMSGIAEVYRAGQLVAQDVRFELRDTRSSRNRQGLQGRIFGRQVHTLARELVTLRFENGLEMDFYLDGTKLESTGAPRGVADQRKS